jgi:hypothetical protein
MSFFISEDTRASFGVEFPVSKEKPVQTGKIDSIRFEKRVTDKPTLLPGVKLEKGETASPDQVAPNSIRGIIVITVNSLDNFYTHVEEKWDNTNSDAKMMSRMVSMLNTQLLHIGAQLLEDEKNMRAAITSDKYMEFIAANYPDGEAGHQWRYLEFVAHAMNTTGHNGGPIWEEADGTPKTIRVKITRVPSGKSINKLQLGNGNVLEVVREGVKSILQVMPKDTFDVLEVAAAKVLAGPLTAQTTQTSKDDNPWPDL